MRQTQCSPQGSLPPITVLTKTSLDLHESELKNSTLPRGSPMKSMRPTSAAGGSNFSSNPSLWEGHYPQKMMDLQYHFSAGPLRIAECTSRQWTRLHAPNKWIIPQPGGAPPLTVQEPINHISDDDLLRTVAAGGLGKPKVQPVNDPATRNTASNANHVFIKMLEKQRAVLSTPEMHERLRANATMPLPKCPPPRDTPLGNTFTEQSAKKGSKKSVAGTDLRSVADDQTSVFSVTTLASSKASSAAVSKMSSAGKAKPEGSLVSAGSGQSKASRVSELSAALKETRTESDTIREAVAATKKRLEAVEKILEAKNRADLSRVPVAPM